MRRTENYRAPVGERRFLRSFRLVRGRLFLQSAARVVCGLEGACPAADEPTLAAVEL